uniref:Phage baseplate assembly protein V n=1 Tax=Arsenophonus endosymbiont of Trialeurodes vaporariorum TaxID=235567 RepID=A0A3B0LVV6_9GAMM
MALKQDKDRAKANFPGANCKIRKSLAMEKCQTMNSAQLLRLIQNLIRVWVVVDVNAKQGCRVKTGNLSTDWLNWITLRAGSSRTMHAPSIGGQVLILSIGGELMTAFVLTGIFFDQYPEPTTSLKADHRVYSDGAVIEYEPANGVLKDSGVKNAHIEAIKSIHASTEKVMVTAKTEILLDAPEVIYSKKLTTATLDVKAGGTMTGNITPTGQFSSNGIVIDKHKHGGVKRGGEQTDGPQ